MYFVAKKTEKSRKQILDAEIGTIRKKRSGRIRVALVYPNRYHVGMSNLGFQTTYRLLNQIDAVTCERVFLPEDGKTPHAGIESTESGSPLQRFDIVAFSVSFENDYPNLLTVIDRAGIPLQSQHRDHTHPLVIAGGVACFINPEPIAPFIDCFLLGEAEAMLEGFFKCLLENGFASGREKKSYLRACAQEVPGTYVPAFYRSVYHRDGTLSTFDPLIDVPDRIKRTRIDDLSSLSTCSTIVTPDTTFERTYLIEVSRGCPHGCRFCSAGFVYRPPRFRPTALLQDCIQQGVTVTDKIGLVGAAVSDLPGIKELCSRALKGDIQLSFSSLRADALDDSLLSVLRRSDVKTATIAPDAGSERMRRVINKGITEEQILTAAELLVANGIPNLKLYFMVGLPTETMDDVEAIVKLCKKIKHVFLRLSRSMKRIGEITLSLNSFVPKPTTPFQWAAMDDVATLKKKIKKIKAGLKKVPNVRVHADVPRWAYVQALLSRGDRKVGDILLTAHQYHGNWPQTLKETPLNSDFYVQRHRSMDEIFPWDFIDHGVNKSFLAREYKRALKEKASPPCPTTDGTCDICGVCAKRQ